MFDKIIYISDRGATVRVNNSEDIAINLMNLHIVFTDGDKRVIGEVDDLDGDLVKVRFLGEIVNNQLLGGVIRKPSLDSTIRVISKDEIPLILGIETEGFMSLGGSPFYDGAPVYLDVNNFFSNHFSIIGNSGSGKSCGVSRLVQNMFLDKKLFPYKANLLFFDSSGEYYNAFKTLNSIDPNYHYRYISTNEDNFDAEKLRLPIYLLNAVDLALLLQVDKHSQLPIIERMLKLARIFSNEGTDDYKNHLIAKAIMAILYTNETAPNKRNEIFSILSSCSTDKFNQEAELTGVGYSRKFRECFLIDNSGNFTESVLLTEYVISFIKEEFENYEVKNSSYYNLETLEKALNFTLISEGWLRNDQTYGDAVTVKVRLHSLITGNNAKYFDVTEYITLESYLSSMLIDSGKKYQIVNINLSDIDDDFAKVITKIYSRLFFDFAKGLNDRASIPFHLIIEEAHRYIQNDKDRFLFGFNIFERIAKEGRKYGVIIGLITQRPVELSDTVISQCSNFLIFKMNHPVDVDYIRKMVPNISDEIVEKQKTLQAGTCLGFGAAFKIPLIVKLEMPNPRPWSGNVDVVRIWNGRSAKVDNGEVAAPVVTNQTVDNVVSSIEVPTMKEEVNPSLSVVSDVVAPSVETAVNPSLNVVSDVVAPSVDTSVNPSLSIVEPVVKIEENPSLNVVSDVVAPSIDAAVNPSLSIVEPVVKIEENPSLNVVSDAGPVSSMNTEAIPEIKPIELEPLNISVDTSVVPSEFNIINNNSTITPSVDISLTPTEGVVTIAPPSEIDSLGN